MIKILQGIAWVGAKFLILLNKIIPKVKGDPNKILLYCDMGLGDLVMFLPTIQALLDKGYELTFRCMRPCCIEVLKGMYPQCNFIENIIHPKVAQIPYWLALYLNNRRNRHGVAIVPMYSSGWFSSLELFIMRIPRVIGHTWRKKWIGFYTDRIEFFENQYQVDAYLDLLKPLIKGRINKELFFKTECCGIPEDYVLIQPFSLSDTRKNCIDFEKIIEENDNVVLIGNKREICIALQKSWGKKCKYYITNIFQAAFLIKNAKHFYSLESGLSNIAAAVKTPTTIFYNGNERIHHPRAIHRKLKYIKYVKV